jgi:hypothetical protein
MEGLTPDDIESEEFLAELRKRDLAKHQRQQQQSAQAAPSPAKPKEGRMLTSLELREELQRKYNLR